MKAGHKKEDKMKKFADRNHRLDNIRGIDRKAVGKETPMAIELEAFRKILKTKQAELSAGRHNREAFAKLGIGDSFVQDNHSRSSKGTLRGLHYQLHHPQAKLCRVVEGEALDVAVAGAQHAAQREGQRGQGKSGHDVEQRPQHGRPREEDGLEIAAAVERHEGQQVERVDDQERSSRLHVERLAGEVR